MWENENSFQLCCCLFSLSWKLSGLFSKITALWLLVRVVCTRTCLYFLMTWLWRWVACHELLQGACRLACATNSCTAYIDFGQFETYCLYIERFCLYIEIFCLYIELFCLEMFMLADVFAVYPLLLISLPEQYYSGWSHFFLLSLVKFSVWQRKHVRHGYIYLPAPLVLKSVSTWTQWSAHWLLLCQVGCHICSETLHCGCTTIYAPRTKSTVRRFNSLRANSEMSRNSKV